VCVCVCVCVSVRVRGCVRACGRVYTGDEEQRRVSYLDPVLPRRLHILAVVSRLVQRLASTAGARGWRPGPLRARRARYSIPTVSVNLGAISFKIRVRAMGTGFLMFRVRDVGVFMVRVGDSVRIRSLRLGLSCLEAIQQ